MNIMKFMRVGLFTVGISVGLISNAVSADAFLFSSLVTGYELSVDGEVWFIVEHKEDISRMIELVKTQSLKGIDQDATILKVDFAQKVEVAEVKVHPDLLASNDTAIELLLRVEETPDVYTVAKGDNLWTIATTKAVSISDIESLNPDLNMELIQPGDEIVLSAIEPVLDIVIELKNEVTEAIPFETETIKDDTLFKSQKVVVNEGKEGQKNVLHQITLVNGKVQEDLILEEIIVSEPSKATIKVGTKSAYVAKGKSNFSIVAGNVSSEYGWRTNPVSGTKRFHSGIDIAADSGTPVKAYSDGTVVAAGWDNALGNYVSIDHGNGLVTRYGHLSSISINNGDAVSSGQEIGKVGKTGYTTGNHLHFEVIKNGSTQNPRNYF